MSEGEYTPPVIAQQSLEQIDEGDEDNISIEVTNNNNSSSSSGDDDDDDDDDNK